MMYNCLYEMNGRPGFEAPGTLRYNQGSGGQLKQEILRPPTLAALVAESIREAVLRGELPQGQRLQESDLGEDYNVSRGTIREALRFLQKEGIVRIIPHRGAVVDTLTPRMIEETYSLRILLECHAVELAIAENNYTPRILHELRTQVSHMGNVRKTSDHIQVIEVDTDFHRRLCAPCDHGMLMELLQGPVTRTRMCMAALAFSGSTILGDPEEHEPILKAVQQGDSEAARQALTRHFRLGMDDLLLRMKGSEPTGKAA